MNSAQIRLSQHRVQAKFDLFDALRNLAEIHDDIEVSVRLREDNIVLRLYAGDRRVEHNFNIERLRDSNINELAETFDYMLVHLKRHV
jgi:hypothetical protein